jgi:hypothetical protein
MSATSAKGSRMKALYLSIALIFVATAAQAESARELRSRCTGMTGVANAFMCRTTVGGVLGTLKDDPAYCIPKDVNNSVALTIVQKYLLSQPGDVSLSASEEIARAMADAYPCPAKP